VTPQRLQAAQMHDRAVTGDDDQDAKYRLYCSAVGVDPDFAQGWMSLGHRLGDMGLLDASAAAYRRALACPEDDQPGSRTALMTAQAYCNLALRLHHMGAHEEAEDAALKCVELDAKMVFGWTNLAMIRSRRGDHYGAIAAGRKAFELDPSKPENELGLAFALLFNGFFAEGLARFEARFEYKLRNYLKYPYPRWKGEVLS
jgi:protein O-GlcNAc transferase